MFRFWEKRPISIELFVNGRQRLKCEDLAALVRPDGATGGAQGTQVLIEPLCFEAFSGQIAVLGIEPQETPKRRAMVRSIRVSSAPLAAYTQRE